MDDTDFGKLSRRIRMSFNKRKYPNTLWDINNLTRNLLSSIDCSNGAFNDITIEAITLAYMVGRGD